MLYHSIFPSQKQEKRRTEHTLNRPESQNHTLTLRTMEALVRPPDTRLAEENTAILKQRSYGFAKTRQTSFRSQPALMLPEREQLDRC